MRKAKSIIFGAIIVSILFGSVKFFFKDSSKNLNAETLNTNSKTTGILTKGVEGTYNLKEVAQEDIMTEEQVIKYLGISSSELINLIDENTSTFPFSRINGTITFSKKAIDKWLERCHVGAIQN